LRAEGAVCAPVGGAKSLCLVLIVYGAAAGGCGGDPADLAPVRLRHEPPIGQMTAEQLRALSQDCEKYPPKDSMRGRYDGRYCEDAIAAWGDSPLQMISLPKTSAPSAP
jgi:hypothetical protein